GRCRDAAMGNRLSKIYTRTGDDGSTGLGDGARVAKDSARVTAYGTVDEANSAIGVVLAQELPDEVREVLVSVQHQLFDLGGELCIPGHAAIHAADIERLESILDRFNAELPPLKDFILRSEERRVGKGCSCGAGWLRMMVRWQGLDHIP